jgi:hypothetical protein
VAQRSDGARVRASIAAGILLTLAACAPGADSATPRVPVSTELPPPSIRGMWTLNGQPAPRNTIQLHAGPEHCGWGSMTLLATANVLGQPITPMNAREYVRDPGNLSKDRTVSAFEPSVLPPGDAVFTGYRFGEMELWFIGLRDDVVFVVRNGIWEQWPRARELFACA